MGPDRQSVEFGAHGRRRVLVNASVGEPEMLEVGAD